MLGILVHGNNHFILSGPPPDDASALSLARHWSVVQIGKPPSPTFGAWTIREKEFRENLQWAVVIPGDRAPSTPATQLLAELSARGIPIHHCPKPCW